MGVAKAALEAVNRYLARDLGPRGVRVNLVSAGPAGDACRARHPRLRRPRRRVAAPGAARAGTSRTRRPSPARSCSCSATWRAPSPARCCTSTAGSTRWAPRSCRPARRPPTPTCRAGGGRMRPPVFLTGATGFLGMEVLARLLEAGDRDVVALVRAPTSRPPRSASTACWASCGAIRRRTAARVHAVAGDLTAPGLGHRPGRAHRAGRGRRRRPALRGVDLVRPAARGGARDQRRGHARGDRARPRGEGARRAWSGSCTSRPPTSRARYPGTFRERQLVAGQEFRNTYEQTKLEAEQIVADAGDLSPAVARPSIVMGESDTGWTPAFNVLYWPLRAFSRGLFDTVPADPAGRVDVVPVDYVADAIVASARPQRGRRVQPRRRAATRRRSPT